MHRHSTSDAQRKVAVCTLKHKQVLYLWSEMLSHNTNGFQPKCYLECHVPHEPRSSETPVLHVQTGRLQQACQQLQQWGDMSPLGKAVS